MVTDAENAANRLRELCWQEGSFPVDPVTIAKRMGLKVLESPLPDDVSGALIKDAGKDPLILLDLDDSDNRKRFSCAHELGHYISRNQQSEEEESYEYLDLRSALSSTGSDPEEVYANQFAAELLMPRSKVSALHKQKLPLFEMALRLGVSQSAIKFRLRNLQLDERRKQEAAGAVKGAEAGH